MVDRKNFYIPAAALAIASLSTGAPRQIRAEDHKPPPIIEAIGNGSISFQPLLRPRSITELAQTRGFERTTIKPGPIEIRTNRWCFAGDTELHTDIPDELLEKMLEDGYIPNGFTLTFPHSDGNFLEGDGNGGFIPYFRLPIGVNKNTTTTQGQLDILSEEAALQRICARFGPDDPIFGIPITAWMRGFAYEPLVAVPLGNPLGSDNVDFYGFAQTTGNIANIHTALLPFASN